MLILIKTKRTILVASFIVNFILFFSISGKSQGNILYSPSITSFITGIDSIEGNLTMDLNNGVFLKTVEQQDIFLKINPNTTSQTHLIMANGRISSLDYKFDKPIIFKDAKGLNCFGVYVTEILLNGTGITITFTSNDNERVCTNLNSRLIKNLKKLFNLTTELTGVMGGSFFGSGNAAVWQDCANNFKVLATKRNIVQRISITKERNQFISVRLKENWKFYFNDSPDYDNYIFTNKGNYFLITDLDCEVGTPRLSLNVNANFVDVKESQIQSLGVNMLLPTPKFSNLVISLKNGEAGGKIINVTGSITSNIKEGSVLQIISATSSSNFAIDKGSSLDVKNFSMEFAGSKNTNVRLGIGTSIILQLKNSDLSLNKVTTVHFAAGKIDGTSIVAEFNSEHAETFWQGALYNVDFKVDGGVIGLNDYSQVNIKNGSLMAKRIDINNTISPQITGKFDQFILYFTPNNTFSCTDKSFIFSLIDGCFVNQSDDDPIHLEKDEDYPLGTLQYHFVYADFSVNDLKQFKLSSGIFEGQFKNLGKEQFAVRNIQLSGTLNVQVKDKVIGTAFDINGRMDFSKQLSPDFVGFASFSFDPLKDPIELKTDCFGDNDLNWDAQCDEHIFPIKLQFNLEQKVLFSNIRIVIKKGILQNFSTQSATTLLIIVPKGYGEYNGDNLDCNNISSNVHNEDRGDDDIKDKQEVARATVCVRRCTWHVWAIDAVYKNPLTLNFEYNLSKETLKPTIVIKPEIDLRGLDIKYNHHGCDDLITNILANLFVDVDKKIHDLIQNKLDEYSDRFSQSITVVP